MLTPQKVQELSSDFIRATTTNLVAEELGGEAFDVSLSEFVLRRLCEQYDLLYAQRFLLMPGEAAKVQHQVEGRNVKDPKWWPWEKRDDRTLEAFDEPIPEDSTPALPPPPAPNSLPPPPTGRWSKVVQPLAGPLHVGVLEVQRVGEATDGTASSIQVGGTVTTSRLVEAEWCEAYVLALFNDVLLKPLGETLEVGDDYGLGGAVAEQILGPGCRLHPLPKGWADDVVGYVDGSFWVNKMIPALVKAFRAHVNKIEMIKYCGPLLKSSRSDVSGGVQEAESTPNEAALGENAAKGGTTTTTACGTTRISWQAIGDWGEWTPALDLLADRMAEHAKVYKKALASPTPVVVPPVAGADTTTTPSPATGVQPLDFVMSIGDNFYPSGAVECGDVEFKMWEKVFLSAKSRSALRVPWKVVLGNHDYAGNPQCQIDFTTHPKNPQGLWHMPDNKYSFSYPVGPNGEVAAFFGFDANVTQYTVRSQYKHKLEEWPADMQWLRDEAKKYDGGECEDGGKRPKAIWKVLFQHHPLYSKGRGHQDEARRLRGDTYRSVAPNATLVQQDGLDQESVLHEIGIDVVLAGHEHVLQQCMIFKDKGHPRTNPSIDPIPGGGPSQVKELFVGRSPDARQGKGPTQPDVGIIHATVGAATECYYWRGELSEEPMDWVGVDCNDGVGFGACEIVTNPATVSESSSTDANEKSVMSESRFTMRFVSTKDGSVIREVSRTKRF